MGINRLPPMMSKGNVENSGKVVAPSSSGLSISDSNIRHCNDVIAANCSRITAGKLLNLGKELGLSTEGNDPLIIDKFMQLEDRDRLAMSARGTEVNLS